MYSNLEDKPVYTVFAGINGAGKSTFYKSENINKYGIRINPDEIAEKLGDANNRKFQVMASREAIRLIKECSKDHISFNQETTLSGNQVLNTMEKLKNEGYKINLIYVGLDSEEEAIKRVATRVENGGHNIDENLIRNRYLKSINNLPRALALSDEAKVFDNSKFDDNNQANHRLLMIMKDDEIKYISKSLPNWFKKIINEVIEQPKQEKVSVKEKLNKIQESNKKNEITIKPILKTR